MKLPNIAFLILQLVVIYGVYITIYMAYQNITYAIAYKGISLIMYFPVFVAAVSMPIILNKYRIMFNNDDRMKAFIWTMGVTSVTILLLIVYTIQIAG